MHLSSRGSAKSSIRVRSRSVLQPHHGPLRRPVFRCTHLLDCPSYVHHTHRFRVECSARVEPCQSTPSDIPITPFRSCVFEPKKCRPSFQRGFLSCETSRREEYHGSSGRDRSRQFQLPIMWKGLSLFVTHIALSTVKIGLITIDPPPQRHHARPLARRQSAAHFAAMDCLRQID